MSEPNEKDLQHEALARFVDEYFNSFTAEKKFEILKGCLDGRMVEEDYQDWLKEQNNEL